MFRSVLTKNGCFLYFLFFCILGVILAVIPEIRSGYVLALETNPLQVVGVEEDEFGVLDCVDAESDSTEISLLNNINGIFDTDHINFASNRFKQSIENVRKAIVSIKVHTDIEPYVVSEDNKSIGFILDRDSGIVVSYLDRALGESIATYELSFYNGKKIVAQKLYYNPISCLALLKVDLSDDMKSQLDSIVVSDRDLKYGDKVLIADFWDYGFGYHEGYISDEYSRDNVFSGSYIINTESVTLYPGIVFDDNFQCVGLTSYHSNTYVKAIKSHYILDISEKFKTNNLNLINHLPITYTNYSLDDAVKHRNFSKLTMDSFNHDFPHYRNTVLIVSSVFRNIFDKNIILPGDILWKVGNNIIGPDITILSKAISNAVDSKIDLVIYRNGEVLNIEVPIIDINKYSISKILDLDGSIIFESDYYTSAIWGIPLGKVVLTHIKDTNILKDKIPSNGYYDDIPKFRVVIESVNGIPISSIDNLVTILQQIKNLRHIRLGYKSYVPIPGFAYVTESLGISSTENYLLSTYSSIRLFERDKVKDQWLSSAVVYKNKGFVSKLFDLLR
ncbi:serine protease family protein [Rickettsia endosymbiont of Cardiosporidium cionae]|uniref:S1C family serine protease n=1 Tax=Rickettsia endosymbiont of Cardiosporidium cionae TaxID=2777155 RepID=UPI0018930813|nr:S1C family serine protease [Rickettsia endosymbiont of Cardiosporidium cionae]